jgi:hypothetical protein
MKTNLILSLGFVVALFAASSEASPIVVYNNFGPGQTYNSTGAYSITGASIPRLGEGEEALAFTPATTVALVSVQLPLEYIQGTNSLIVSLRPDVGGQPGTTPIESFTFTGLSATSTVVEGDSVLLPHLNVGVTYWIAVFPGGADTAGGWLLNSTGAVGRSFSANGSTWTNTPADTSPALEVLGNPVPEPGSAVLLVSSFVCLVAWRLRIRRCV